MYQSKLIFATVLIIFRSLLAGLGAPPGRIQLPGHGLPAAARSAPQGRFPATNQLQLAIGLPLRDEAGLDHFLAEIYDPASPSFRKYLTPQEFTARFGPTESDYATVQEFIRTNGLKIVGTHPNRLVLDVVGRVSDIERTFQVVLQTYRHPRENRDFFAPDIEPSTDLVLPIQSISGLDNYSLPQPKSTAKPLSAVSAAAPLAGSGSGGSYLGNDFRAAYVPGTALTGSGQSVALLQFDGYYLNDIASYLATAGYPASLTNVLANVAVNGGVATPGSGNGEVCLDIEMVMAMAPGIAKLYVYEGPNGSTAWSTILSKIANDNLAKQVSCSWGATSPGSPDMTSENIFKQMAAQGMSFFNASGDSDAFVGGIPFPSESTNITQVGGTTLSTTGPSGAWLSETAWNWGYVSSQSKYIGTSGGVSANFAMPVWQQGISMAANLGSTTMRNVPDVALTGDNVYVAYNNGGSGNFGGTSCAAPLWAGFMALVNQQAAIMASPPVGFINPAIYAIGKSGNYSSCFHDTATGNNYSSSSPANFPAVSGFDLCTGWGTPDGTNLINTLVPPAYFVAISSASWLLQSESAVPVNGAIDPGETVTVSFTLQNQGNLPSSNLVATLLPNAGVLAPGGPQTYGVLASLGGSANKPFTFTAAGVCGTTITAMLQLQDGTNNLGLAAFTLPLGKGFGLSQNFDGVTAPGLPSGWAATNVYGTAASWGTTTASSDTSPNSAFLADPTNPAQNALLSPLVFISSATAQLSFRHNYSLEYTGNRLKTYYDGGVLEVKIGNGAFSDILAAGGSFVTGGYNSSITTSSDNPLGGRSAWVGSSSTWKTVTVKLPAAAAGQNIQLRWNCATDTDNGNSSAVGWYVDSISITDSVPTCLSVFTDLAVGQSLAANSSLAGQDLVYTLSVINLGPQSAANVILTDTVPANVTFSSASPGCTYSNGQVVCPVGTLAAGVVTNFTVTLAPAGGSIFTNHVSAGTVTPEISTVNNTVSLVSTQIVLAPAGISVGPASQTIQCGGNATLSLVVTGTLPLSIEWWIDGVPIVGATNTSLLLTNLHMPGHLVSVLVTNLYGNAASNATVAVQDTLAPVVALIGGNPDYVELGGAFNDPGAAANDACAGTVPVTVSGTVNLKAVGTNTLTYTADDGNGNTNTVTRKVIVRDTVPPTILWSFSNLVVAADMNCSAVMPDVTGTNYINAIDLSGALTITQIPTNNSILQMGTNAVVITVADGLGNKSYSANRIVVQDQTPPVIVLNGFNPLTNELGAAFVDPGVSASDTCSGLALLTTNGEVNVNAISTNTVTYTATDGNGNPNTATRTVLVQDTTPPVITWSFANLVMAADANCSAVMPDVTGTSFIIAVDLSGVLTVTQSPTNNTTLQSGTNAVVITVADGSGNKSYSTNRIVVQDQTPPVIVLNGFNPLTNELGAAYDDPGVSASDNCSGLSLLTTNGTVNVNVVGTNLLTYMATDGNGNTNTVTRTVIVRDTVPPTILWSFSNLVVAADTNCSAVMPDVTGTNYINATDLSGALTITQIPTNNAILQLGTNAVVITVADASGNKSYSTNGVIVRDQTPPVITLIGNNPFYLDLGSAFIDPGATAFDGCAGVVPVIVTGVVNTNTAGTNSLGYTANDGSGNTNSATRTVIVRDPVPIIAGVVLAGNGGVTLNLGGTPGRQYILETTEEFFPASWLPMATNTLDASGTWQFTDLQATNFMLRFYRLKRVP
ncbi:MAG: immunoglobulin-like domain-containing protein [Verrucomicrobiota bacterium]